jgi:hypothetical protein
MLLCLGPIPTRFQRQTEDSMVNVLNNPDVQAAVRFEEGRTKLVSMLANRIMDIVPWDSMNANQRKVCVRHIVSEVETKEELEKRLLDDFGIDCAAIDWCQPDSADQTSMEAQMLVKALGGLVSKSGAMVSIMTFDDMF